LHSFPKNTSLAQICQQEPLVIKTNRRNRPNTVVGLQKERTGISRSDEITGG
jgi:hypothetical protein